jgi:hypothetical protein
MKTRWIAVAMIVAALFLAPAYSQAATTGTTALSATVPVSQTLTVTTGGTLTFGSVVPTGLAAPCVVLNGTALAPTSSVQLSIVSNAVWSITITSNDPNGKLLNGTTPTTNPVQWASSAVSTSGFGAWANLNSTGATEGSGSATTGASNFAAFQWCGSTSDGGGTYTGTVTYTLHSP